MFKFIKNSQDLTAANIEAEVINRAKKRFNGIDAMVFGWVVQTIDTQKILWAVVDFGFEDNIRQMGMICMTPGKPLVYVNITNLTSHVPEMVNAIIHWDTTSVTLGLNNATVISTVYGTPALVAKGTRLYNEGRNQEAMAINPPLTLIDDNHISESRYIPMVKKVRAENGLLAIPTNLPGSKSREIGEYAESESLVETVRVVMC